MLFSFLSFVGAVFGCFFKSGTIDLGCEMREEEAEPSLFLPPSLDENKKTWYYWLVCDVTWLYLHPFVSTAGELSVCFPPSPPVRLSAIQSENNSNYTNEQRNDHFWGFWCCFFFLSPWNVTNDSHKTLSWAFFSSSFLFSDNAGAF